MSVNRPSPAHRRDDEQVMVVVTAPPPHEGVRRALTASFGQIPALPEEFVRLLGTMR